MVSLLLQADGGIIAAGSQSASALAITRLTSTGATDPTFASGLINTVRAIALQPDGQVLAAGAMASPAGFNYLSRLEGTPAVSTLAVPDLANVEWSLGGSFPDLTGVTFRRYSSGSSSAVSLPTANRTASAWKVSGLALPASGIVAARGRTKGGYYGGSNGAVERYANYGGTAPVMKVTGPQAQVLASNTGVVDLGAVLSGNSLRSSFTIANQGTGYLGDFSWRITGPQAADFRLVWVSGPLLPAQSGSLQVSFSPQAAGPRLATLEITSNATPSPFLIQLSGTGIGTVFSPSFATAAQAGTTYAGFKASDLSLGQITLGFSPQPGTILKLVNNTASTAVTGTFANLAEGSIVSATFGALHYDFFVLYAGGDGNDVMLLLKGPGVVDPAYAPVVRASNNAPIVLRDGPGTGGQGSHDRKLQLRAVEV